jgi:hypothetical protein
MWQLQVAKATNEVNFACLYAAFYLCGGTLTAAFYLRDYRGAALTHFFAILNKQLVCHGNQFWGSFT